MTMMVQSGLDMVGRETPVEQVMRELDRLIEKRGGERFVTGIYATITPEGLLAFSNTGHPPLILLPGKKPCKRSPNMGESPLAWDSPRRPTVKNKWSCSPATSFSSFPTE